MLTINVAPDGSGQFTTISEAVLAVPYDCPAVIRIAPGIYREKLVCEKQDIALLGAGMDRTRIVWGDGGKLPHKDGRPTHTFRSYTAFLGGECVTVEDLTIENDAGPGAQVGQAVAAYVDSARAAFDRVRLLGNQDTVYTGIANNRSAFYDCYIEGTTDFIFGPGRAWFENCEIRSKANSYITAASSPAGQEYGYVFNKCKLTAEPGIDKVYLGRPWRPYAATLFMNCEMGSHIRPEGWHNWGKHSNEQTARYSEYNNHGSGAATKARVAWSRQLTKKEAAKVTIKNVFGEEAW